MIPFATPQDGEVVNLNQIIRWKKMPYNECRVTFADGVTRTYKDDAAKIMFAEIAFNLTAYRSYVLAAQQAIKEQNSLIVPPDFSNGRPS